VKISFITIGFWALMVAVGGCALDKQQSDQSIRDHETERDKQMAAAKPAATPRINPMTHMAAGQMLEKQGDFKGAIDQYEKAVAANPKLASGYNRLGVVQQKMGRLQEAERVFRVGIDAAPSSPGLRNNLGYCYLVQRRFDDAQEQFTAALSVAPNFKRAHMNLGIVFAQSGQMDKGLAEFKRVVTLDTAHYNLAIICLSSGDYANAEKALKRALAINPSLKHAQEKLDELHALASAQNPGSPGVTTPQGRFQTASVKGGAPAPIPQIPLAGSADDENVFAPK
jgi:tetratricopeptide (TPR) repeat protein